MIPIIVPILSVLGLALLAKKEEESAVMLPPNWKARFTLKPQQGMTVRDLYNQVLDLPDAVNVIMAPKEGIVHFEASDEEPLILNYGDPFPGLPGNIARVELL